MYLRNLYLISLLLCIPFGEVYGKAYPYQKEEIRDSATEKKSKIFVVEGTIFYHHSEIANVQLVFLKSKKNQKKWVKSKIKETKRPLNTPQKKENTTEKKINNPVEWRQSPFDSLKQSYGLVDIKYVNNPTSQTKNKPIVFKMVKPHIWSFLLYDKQIISLQFNSTKTEFFKSDYPTRPPPVI